jgi:hypothetical protein
VTEVKDGGAVIDFHIVYGWMADSIEDQLKGWGLQMEGSILEQFPKWQRLADSVNMLKLHGYMRDSESARIRNKLASDIEKWLVKNEYLVAAREPTQ